MFAASKSGSAADPTDPQFNYVTMLLHGDGTNGAQNNTFLDSSTNNFSITRNGNTTQGTFTPYGSNWSNYFGGSPYLETPSNVAFSWGTGDFSIEFFVFPTSTSTLNRCVHFSDDLSNLAIDASNRVELWTGSAFNSGSYTVSPNIWTHICATRVSGTCRLFINGMLVASTSNSFNKGTGSAQVGGSGAYGNDLSGYLSNVRLLKGAIPSGYSTSSTTAGTQVFIPSTSPLTAESGTSLLTCQSNRFVDNSSNAFALTVNGSPSIQRFSPFSPTTAYSTSVISGSVYLDGSDSLSIPSVPASGTGSFCFEAWIYPTNASTNQMIIGAVNGGMWVGMNIDTGNKFSIGRAFTANDNEVSFTWANNRWYHVAVNRNGTSLQFFVDGVQIGSTLTNSINYSVAGRLIGAEGTTPATFYSGYIAGLRVVNASVYTSAFTPPTAPPSVIANTTLLTNFTNAGILDNAMMNDLETVGNAQISTSVKKYGTGSIAFDGTGDWLQAVSTPQADFGSGNFTLECWAYLNNFSTDYRLMAKVVNISSYGSWQVLVDTSGYPRFYASSAASSWDVANGTGGGIAISTSTWAHIAVTRSGSTITMWVNGVSAGTSTSSASLYFSASVPVTVGGMPDGTRSLNGNLDEVRITKGLARYTSTFTPSTTAFADKG